MKLYRIPPAFPYTEINKYTTDMQKNKNTYDAPTITIVEVKACGRMCSASSNARILLIGTPSDSYGLQDFGAGSEQNW